MFLSSKTSDAMEDTNSIAHRSSLSINALCTCLYIHIQQLSFFRAPTLWFIDLTVPTCHIRYTFLSSERAS